MKQAWFRLSSRLDALSLRERAMIFAAVLASVVFAAYALVLSPLFARQEALGARIASQQDAIVNIEEEINRLSQAAQVDPDAANRARLVQARGDVDKLVRELRNLEQSLVTPERIVPLLETMLQSNGRLRLVSLTTLPVTGASEAMPATAPVAKAAAEPVVDPAVAGAAGSAAPAGKAPELLYRHGVEVTLQGSYGDMVNYMVQLEALPVRLIWGHARLDARNYPDSRLTLRLYTLSLEKEWMKL